MKGGQDVLLPHAAEPTALPQQLLPKATEDEAQRQQVLEYTALGSPGKAAGDGEGGAGHTTAPASPRLASGPRAGRSLPSAQPRRERGPRAALFCAQPSLAGPGQSERAREGAEGRADQ